MFSEQRAGSLVKRAAARAPPPPPPGAIIQGRIKGETGCGCWGGERRGSSRPGQAELLQRQQPPCPADLIYAACSTSTAGWREAGGSCRVGGLCGGLARVGWPQRLRRPALSTLDSNTKGSRGHPRPFSTGDSGPAATPHLPAAETLGQGRMCQGWRPNCFSEAPVLRRPLIEQS
ncbi:uncharacterized protein LOC119470442 [Cebus imitator]|uniref:uncharacterized protein LOC119470442 n=1 Tax=Cebus imitator TaxID=2715852 RepID=UPI0018981EF9|nr:uncharacterized protein LOC119470442 [Cebus imitator]